MIVTDKRLARKESQWFLSNPLRPALPVRVAVVPERGLKRVAFIGNHGPRQCGIATFTSHLVDAVSSVDPDLKVSVTSMNDRPEGYVYPDRVDFQIDDQDLASYKSAAAHINCSGADAVSLQHEFGIFGGPAGSHLLTLLKHLDIPVVATLHTILRDPNHEQQYVMDQLNLLCQRFVVMSQRAVQLLVDVYGFDRNRIDMIHHGIPDIPFDSKQDFLKSKGVDDGKMLMTFGLLGPGKGIEHAIRAMPEIVASHPDAKYMIVGATHPNLVQHEGERYREHLIQLADDLNVGSNILFYNRFVTQKELEMLLMAADVYITPYPHIEQICSGTLAYALGCGNAVVSTPYWHAQELLASGRGVLVPVNDPAGIAGAVTRLLDDPQRRLAMQRRAHAYGREMIWSEVGARYLESFRRARSSRSNRAAVLTA
ncbi:MAG: glycosyltransferase family 4 protein [Phycisphaerales bacterium]|nr:glycosyltransferase family 4 protein [Phycisphaerales bacterium]